MPCYWRLPVNADTTLVALFRPITFLSAVIFSLVAFAYSSFLNISGLAPIECRCPTADKSPRTRPRPQTPSSAPPTPPSNPDESLKPSPLESLSSFSSFVANSFRPRRPPPVARRGSHNKTLPYPVHELDEVVEEEDGEAGSDFRDYRNRVEIERGVPGLTPDVSEGDDTSSLETMDDCRVEVSKKTRSKAFLGNFRWKKNSSDDGTTHSSGSRSPSEEHGHPFSTPPTSEHPRVSPPKSAFKHSSSRPRSATSSTSSGRSVHFIPRRQTSLDSVSSTESNDSLGGPAPRSRKPLSISTSSSTSHPRTLFSKSSFRSLSPLSRSPVTTPEPSPPTSPRSANCPFSKNLATRLSRSASVDSHYSNSRGRRNRSGSPSADSVPRLRRGASATDGLGIDSTGSSDLRLDDLLR